MMQIRPRHRFAAFGALAAAPVCHAQFFTVTGVPPALWSAPDALIGVEADSVIEDFEDTALIPGLQIAVTTPTAGAYGPTSTLPATFDPVAQDSFGNVFDLGPWDGLRVLVNTATNQSASYVGPGNWGDVQLVFDTPVRSLGFSVQQMDLHATLSINGFPMGPLLPLAGLSAGGGRNGYVRIQANNPSTAAIRFVEINNAAGDGFVIDHVAVRFVFCPGDANGDGWVDFGDLNRVVSAFNTKAGEPGYDDGADFDDDGVVDFEDLNVVLGSFNDPCAGGGASAG